MPCRWRRKIHKSKPFIQGVGALVGTTHYHSECDPAYGPLPRSGRTTRNFGSSRGLNYVPLVLEAEVRAILDLAPLERFVFVISVLERYSEDDCSILLGCSRRDVAASLAPALQHLGRLMNFHKNETDASSEGLSGPETSRLVCEMTIARYFATSGWNPSCSP